jgi:hypothetical protein
MTDPLTLIRDDSARPWDLVGRRGGHGPCGRTTVGCVRPGAGTPRRSSRSHPVRRLQCLHPLTPSYRVAVHPEAVPCSPIRDLSVLKPFALRCPPGRCRSRCRRSHKGARRADGDRSSRAQRKASGCTVAGQSRAAAWSASTKPSITARDRAMLLCTSHWCCRCAEKSVR